MSSEKMPDDLKEQLRSIYQQILKADDDLINRLIVSIQKEWPDDPIGAVLVRQIEDLRKRRPTNN
jgi:succinate dehydrogenase flavin-adding protein (antitoxin of CptAB toxin-antitoxin module)